MANALLTVAKQHWAHATQMPNRSKIKQHHSKPHMHNDFYHFKDQHAYEHLYVDMYVCKNFLKLST